MRVDPDAKVFRGAVDLRYAGLTPAQWCCFVAFFVGIYFLKRTHGAPYVRQADLEPEGPEDYEPEEEAAEDEHEDEDERQRRGRGRLRRKRERCEHESHK